MNKFTEYSLKIFTVILAEIILFFVVPKVAGFTNNTPFEAMMLSSVGALVAYAIVSIFDSIQKNKALTKVKKNVDNLYEDVKELKQEERNKDER